MVEKVEHSVDGAKRLNEEQVAAIANLKALRIAGKEHTAAQMQATSKTNSRTSSQAFRGPGTPSPKYKKFDATLKAELLARETEQNEIAKRD